MSTTTRHKKPKDLDSLIARYTMLFTTSIDLTRKGLRSDQQVKVLLHALQLFKENKLGGAVSLEAGNYGSLPENIFEMLSIKIEDLPLEKRTKRYFLSKGIWYVGEVFQEISGYSSDDRSIPKSVNDKVTIEHGLKQPGSLVFSYI